MNAKEKKEFHDRYLDFDHKDFDYSKYANPRALEEARNSYIRIDYSDIKGFDDLEEGWQKLLIDKYKHTAAGSGMAYKYKMIPQAVELRPGEDFLRIFYHNYWMHLTATGEYY